jgi:glutathione synthetase
MVSSLYPDYPPALSEERQKYLLFDVKDWSISFGLAARPSPSFVPLDVDPEGVLATTAPVTLFPSLFPRSCFDEALAIQTTYNKLYSAIARDEAWLEPIIEELLSIDDFVAQLWKVQKSVADEGYAQDLALGLFRSDYMVHIDPSELSVRPDLRQVEFNTIASSFGGLSTKVASLHRHLWEVDAYPPSSKSLIKDEALPESKAASSLAAGLAAAHKAYGSSAHGHPLTVIFLVEEPERNVFDQRHLEYSLLLNHGVRSFRLSFHRIMAETELSVDRALLYYPPHSPETPFEVTTVYFRAGYTPDDYQGQEAWDARLHIERSKAIKCPNILTHLAGCKKIQQVLATPNAPHLSRFLPDKAEAARVRKTFAPIYPMDESEAGKEARKLASNPDTANKYVLKPQREGGGNNVYRKAIPEFLKKTPQSHWPAYILMEMIETPSQRNAILRNGVMQKGGVICELGVYGVCLWSHSRGDILENWEAGYLLRTKGDRSEEGGVAAGFGAIDSCCLVDM